MKAQLTGWGALGALTAVLVSAAVIYFQGIFSAVTFLSAIFIVADAGLC